MLQCDSVSLRLRILFANMRNSAQSRISPRREGTGRSGRPCPPAIPAVGRRCRGTPSLRVHTALMALLAVRKIPTLAPGIARLSGRWHDPSERATIWEFPKIRGTLGFP